MQNVLMLKTALGANDGITVKEYVEGNRYQISDDLAKNFLVLGVCQVADEVLEEKAIETAPTNKSKKAAPKNKKAGA